MRAAGPVLPIVFSVWRQGRRALSRDRGRGGLRALLHRAAGGEGCAGVRARVGWLIVLRGRLAESQVSREVRDLDARSHCVRTCMQTGAHLVKVRTGSRHLGSIGVARGLLARAQLGSIRPLITQHPCICSHR